MSKEKTRSRSSSSEDTTDTDSHNDTNNPTFSVKNSQMTVGNLNLNIVKKKVVKRYEVESSAEEETTEETDSSTTESVDKTAKCDLKPYTRVTTAKPDNSTNVTEIVCVQSGQEAKVKVGQTMLSAQEAKDEQKKKTERK
ncbi:hypothetical protein BgiBS90_026157 [Biomphalaria glabrata]|nr:hypothetical protein BgiBS90_026157 [Biomphalaria glabrata]